VRDEIVDYVHRWTERAELPTRRLLGWLGLGTSKFHTWKDRYGQVNEHNGKIPRDFWLEDWEKQAILDFHDRHPLIAGGSHRRELGGLAQVLLAWHFRGQPVRH
jgi:hypothetical protein